MDFALTLQLVSVVDRWNPLLILAVRIGIGLQLQFSSLSSLLLHTTQRLFPSEEKVRLPPTPAPNRLQP